MEENSTLRISEWTFNVTAVSKFSTGATILIYSLYNLVFVMAVLGNFLVLYVIYSLPRMRTVTNLFLFNLACGDLLMAILCVPFTYITVLVDYWPFGSTLCSIISPANAISVLVSAFTLVALSLERYFAILHPLQPRMRKKQALISIVVVWAAALITASPIAVVTKMGSQNATNLPVCEERWGEFGCASCELYYSIALMILQYFFPVAILIFTYSRIAIVVLGGGRHIVALDGQHTKRQSGKAVVVTFAVVVTYTIAWLPLNIYTVYLHTLEAEDMDPSNYTMEYIFIACHLVAMAHSTFNPFIYVWVNHSFRHAFRVVLKNSYQKLLSISCCNNDENMRKNISNRKRSSVWTTGSRSNSDYIGQLKNGFLRAAATSSTNTTNTPKPSSISN